MLGPIMLLWELRRVRRVLGAVGCGVSTNDILRYFKADSSRKWLSVGEQVSGIRAMPPSSEACRT